MSELSTAYKIAEDLHTTLFLENDLFGLDESDLRMRGITLSYSGRSKTERVSAHSESDGRFTSQSLSRSPKTGFYYLATTVNPSRVPLQQMLIRPEISNPGAEENQIAALMGSLFMARLAEIVDEQSWPNSAAEPLSQADL